jgi:hypothetical protein
MSTHHWDYIPAKDSELVLWSANFTAQIEANAAAWYPARRSQPFLVH